MTERASNTWVRMSAEEVKAAWFPPGLYSQSGLAKGWFLDPAEGTVWLVVKRDDGSASRSILSPQPEPIGFEDAGTEQPLPRVMRTPRFRGFVFAPEGKAFFADPDGSNCHSWPIRGRDGRYGWFWKCSVPPVDEPTPADVLLEAEFLERLPELAE